MGLDAASYLRQLKQLLPPGDGLNREPGTVLHKMLFALADELARFDARVVALRNEWDPTQTLEMLTDWERILGLPDPCITDEQTIDQRRNGVVQKYTLKGGQSAAFFIDLASRFGYTITTSRYTVFRAGRGRAGDRCYGIKWAHAWNVESAETTTTHAVAGGAVAGDPIRSWGNDQLECAIRSRAPAHTIPIFIYAEE